MAMNYLIHQSSAPLPGNSFTGIPPVAGAVEAASPASVGPSQTGAGGDWLNIALFGKPGGGQISPAMDHGTAGALTGSSSLSTEAVHGLVPPGAIPWQRTRRAEPMAPAVLGDPVDHEAQTVSSVASVATPNMVATAPMSTSGEPAESKQSEWVHNSGGLANSASFYPPPQAVVALEPKGDADEEASRAGDLHLVIKNTFLSVEAMGMPRPKTWAAGLSSYCEDTDTEEISNPGSQSKKDDGTHYFLQPSVAEAAVDDGSRPSTTFFKRSPRHWREAKKTALERSQFYWQFMWISHA